jgi:hypothetical protein
MLTASAWGAQALFRLMVRWTPVKPSRRGVLGVGARRARGPLASGVGHRHATCMDAAGGDLVLRRSRFRALLWTIIALLLFGVGGAVELKDKPVIGYASLVFALLSVIVFAPGIVRPRDLVRLGRSGLTQVGLAGHDRFVPWSEVTEVTTVQRSKVTSVCVSVRDPDKILRGMPRRLWHIARGHWWSASFKAVLGALALAVEGPAAASDLKDIMEFDATLHGIIEIPCSGGFPLTPDALASLLREWQQRYAAPTASGSAPGPDSPPTRPAPSPGS